MQDIKFEPVPIDDLPESLRPVHDYWRQLKGTRIAPTWPEFDMLQIPLQMLPFTMVKDVETDPRAYRYRFYGTGFVEMNGSDLTGGTTDDVSNSAFAAAIRASLDVFTQQFEPCFYRVTTRIGHHHEDVQSLFRMPISDDQERVTSVVSIASKHIDKNQYHEIQSTDDGWTKFSPQ